MFWKERPDHTKAFPTWDSGDLVYPILVYHGNGIQVFIQG
jgi:hypothetical protein